LVKLRLVLAQMPGRGRDMVGHCVGGPTGSDEGRAPTSDVAAAADVRAGDGDRAWLGLAVTRVGQLRQLAGPRPRTAPPPGLRAAPPLARASRPNCTTIAGSEPIRS